MRAGIFQRGRQPGLCAEDNNRVVKDAQRCQALSWHPVSWSAFLHSATAPVQPCQKHPPDGAPEALSQCGLRDQYRRSDAPRSSSDLHRNRCSHSALIRKTRRFPEAMLARCWHHHAGQHDTARHDPSSCFVRCEWTRITLSTVPWGVRAEFNADRRSGPASASPITEIQAAMRPPRNQHADFILRH